ncbi:MAG TPA: methyltransferase domain-containing protein [Candidatus Angelobacter sp.]|nr:methyltransferase domain-containing protein [Candidatus Angelobacter sp.]
MVRWSEVYANTEILSPIDRQTWQVIGEIFKISDSSRVIELASGKGALAHYFARNFGCRVDGYDLNSEFVDYSNDRARDLGLESKVKFTRSDINRLKVTRGACDLGACFGALYIFRPNGWDVLAQAVKPHGFFAISDMVCKKSPPPKELADVFFEGPDQPLTREGARRWYTSWGARILREETCSLGAWLEYYD